MDDTLYIAAELAYRRQRLLRDYGPIRDRQRRPPTNARRKRERVSRSGG